MSLRTLFALVCASLNACPDWIWCCGNREVSHPEAPCEIEDLDTLKSHLEYENKLIEDQGQSWKARLSDESLIFVTPSKVSCTLNLGITEVDSLRFDVKEDGDGKKIVKWFTLCYNFHNQALPVALQDMPAECDYINVPLINLAPHMGKMALLQSFTKFLLGAQKLSPQKALFDSNTRKIYIPGASSSSPVFVWPYDQRQYHGAILINGTFTSAQDLRQEWECDINAIPALKTRLEGRTIVTTKEGGSWYADLKSQNGCKYFIFVDEANQKCYCDLDTDETIYGIKFTVATASGKTPHRNIRWTASDQ